VVQAPISSTVVAAIDRFHSELRVRFAERLREFVLFGSQARGESHEDSDVDLLVVIDGLTEAERKEVFDLAYDAGSIGDDYVVLSPLPYSVTQVADMRVRERRLMREIERDGVALWPTASNYAELAHKLDHQGDPKPQASHWQQLS
jgi:predicted nucleotidyltransferase